MKLAENMWLGSVAAQQNLLHMMNYSSAVYSNAALQGLHLGLRAPMAFWTAMARVGGPVEIVHLEAAPVVPVPDPDPAPIEPPSEAPVEGAAPGPAPVMAEIVEIAAPARGPESTPAPAPDVEAADPTINPVLLDGPRGGRPDDLTVISGVGAKLAQTLNEFGIYHYDQLATLTPTGIDWLNEQQPGFKALVARFDVVNQAKTLAV